MHRIFLFIYNFAAVSEIPPATTIIAMTIDEYDSSDDDEIDKNSTEHVIVFLSMIRYLMIL